jgi:hypothetical protein
MSVRRDPHADLHSERGGQAGEHPGWAAGPVVKAHDLAWLEFEKPDLARAEGFARDFGFAVTLRTGDELHLRGSEPGTPCLVVRRGRRSRFVGTAFRAAERQDVARLAAATGGRVSPLPETLGGVAVDLRDPSGGLVRVVSDALDAGLEVRTALARRRCRHGCRPGPLGGRAPGLRSRRRGDVHADRPHPLPLGVPAGARRERAGLPAARPARAADRPVDPARPRRAPGTRPRGRLHLPRPDRRPLAGSADLPARRRRAPDAAAQQRAITLHAVHPGTPLSNWLRSAHTRAALIRPDATVLRTARNLDTLINTLP